MRITHEKTRPMKAICKKDCYFENELSFKKGNKYQVLSKSDNEACLRNEQGEAHFLENNYSGWMDRFDFDN